MHNPAKYLLKSFRLSDLNIIFLLSIKIFKNRTSVEHNKLAIHIIHIYKSYFSFLDISIYFFQFIFSQLFKSLNNINKLYCKLKGDERGRL